MRTKLGPFKALIFDQDGTLLDSESMHCRSWMEVSKRHKVKFTVNDFSQLSGKGDLAIAEDIKEKGGLDNSASGLKKEKRDYYKKHLDDIDLVRGALEFIRKAYQFNLPIALATISPREETQRVVKKFKLDQYLKVIVDEESVEKGRIKPLPDIYLVAAQKLNQRPENCCAFEDSLTGVEAAKRAGMTCVAIPTKFSRQLNYKRADLVVKSLNTLSIRNNFIEYKP